MRIVFFGTSGFAVGPLKALVNSRHDIACVVTQPAKKKGRGYKIAPGAIEEFALKKAIEVLKFDDVNSASAINALKEKGADLFIVAAFGQILKQDVLRIPKLYPINIHASLLPKYRGASPIQRAILNGDKTTGITIIIMNEFLDKGDMIAQGQVKIEERDDVLSLTDKLSKCSEKLVLKTVDRIEAANIKPIPQDDKEAIYAPKLTKADGLIDWNKHADEIVNQIRACRGWPFAYTYLDKKLLRVLKAEKSDFALSENNQCAKVMYADEGKLIVSCKCSSLSIRELQLEGKKPLMADEFLRGHDIAQGTILG
jgi:methionyl-tRNA formyltransferase